MKLKGKYLSYLIAAVILLFAFAPNVMAEKYFGVSELKLNNSDITYPSYSNSWLNDKEIIEINLYNPGNFSFKVTANELDNDKNYVVTLKSDFINEVKTYTGAELNDGVTITIDNAISIIDMTINEQGTSNYVDYKYTRVCNYTPYTCNPVDYYDVLSFYFDNTYDLSELDAFYNAITKNGKIKINAIKLPEEYAESSISEALKKYNTDKIRAVGYCYEGTCYLDLIDITNYRHYKDYIVEYEYEETNEVVKARLDKYTSSFNFTMDNIEDNLFPLVDLENLNYKYATLNNNNIDTLNSIINYSSAIQKYFANDNVTLALDARAGWDEDFTSGGFGFLNILYKGVVYATVDPVGVKQLNVIYVPDGTQKTREAYISAAKTRIEEYLKGVNVEITYAGQIADIDTSDWIYPLEKLIDVSKTTGEYYNVTINGTTFKFFIEEGSDKMNVPFMNTKDINTNIYITSDSFKAPLDSKINAQILDKNSDEYKELLKKLKLTDGTAFNLSLFSESLDMYITKLDDGTFKVYIPLEGDALNKEYIAYYYNDDGTVEKHTVKIENSYAVFETNHFSTYVLSEVSNPNTADVIVRYIAILVVSMIGLVGAVYYIKSKKA